MTWVKVCPTCGNLPRAGDQFCVKCGQRLAQSAAQSAAQPERRPHPDVKLTTCTACHKQTPFPEPEAVWGTALACIHCHTPFIQPSDPENPLPTSPERLNLFFGLVGRGLEHPRCPFCRKINYGIVFPAKGMALAWYALPDIDDPQKFAFRMECVHCAKEFYVEWEENPF